MAPFSSIEELTTTATAVDFFDFDDSSSLEFSTCSSSSSTSTSVTSLRSSLRSETSSRSCSNTTVTFSDDMTIYPVLHIHDFSLAEKWACWLNAEDMRVIRQEWKTVVEVMEMCGHNGSIDDAQNDDFCVRGLEGKTYVGKRRRQEARALSMEVVLDEQLYQSSPDPFTIATAYSNLVFPLHVEAFERAQQDAQAAGSDVECEQMPTKFDFQAVRAKFFASQIKENNGISDEDATLSIYEKHDSANNKELLKRQSFSFSLNCFLPMSPKRHSRRSLRRNKAPRYL